MEMNVGPEKNLRRLRSFLARCFKWKVDYIIPIGSESLAVLIPYLKEQKYDISRIIPSGSLVHFDGIGGKNFLIMDITVNSGASIQRIKDQLFSIGAKQVAVVALYVRKNSPIIGELANTDSIQLDSDEYFAVKEWVIQFMLDEIFVRDGDPPLWEMRLADGSRHDLFEILLTLGYTYSIPDYGVNSKWTRVSVDDIFLLNDSYSDVFGNVNSRSIVGMRIEQPAKIRLLLSKNQKIVKMLPLVHPHIVPGKDSTIYSEVARLERLFPPEYENLLRYSREIPLSPNTLYRWISTVFSLWLLKDFLKALIKAGVPIELDSLGISAPIPNIYYYSCSSQILDALENLLKAMLSEELSEREFLSPDRLFDFRRNYGRELTSRFSLKHPYSNLTPEEGLLNVFSSWLIEREKSQGKENPAIDMTISIEQLRKEASFMEPVAISRALDKLIDEGIVKTRIGALPNGATGRVYTIGSETIKKRVRAVGMALSRV